MKRYLYLGALTLLVGGVVYGQQSMGGRAAPAQSQVPGAQNQQPPANVPQNNMGTAPNGAQLPATGNQSGNPANPAAQQQPGNASQIGGVAQFRVGAITTSDQPMATQVQQALSAEPVLSQTLPSLQIQVNNGNVILDGDVQCGAEGALMEHIIHERLGHGVHIQNRLRGVNNAFAPATTAPR